MSERIGGSAGAGRSASDASAAPPGSTTTGSRRSLGAVIASAFEGVRTLAAKHVALARIEAAEAMSIRAKGAGMMASAAVIGLFAIWFVAASGSAALDLVLPTWLAHLVVGVLLGAVAAGLVAAGRRAIQTAPAPLEGTQQRLKEDARWARQQLAR